MAVSSTELIRIQHMLDRSLYCRFCGGPMLNPDNSNNPEDLTWLGDIVALRENETSVFGSENVNIFPARICKKGIEQVYAWVSPDNGTLTVAPCHSACLGICYLVLEHNPGAGTAYDQGGPPTSIMDIFQVIKARVSETYERHQLGSAPITLFELSGYGRIECYQEHHGWELKTLYDEKSKVWVADPMALDVGKEQQNIPLGKWSTKRLPPEMLHKIFMYAYDLTEVLPSACNYVFPQSWWRDIVRQVNCLKDITLPHRVPNYNWERLARDISRIPESYVPGIDGLRNRKRIWDLISNMRRNDMFDLRTRYCSRVIDIDPCQVFLSTGDDWCENSWTAFKASHGYSEDWVPNLGDGFRSFHHNEERMPFPGFE